MRRSVLLLASAAGAVLGWGELLHWRASHLLTHADPGGPEAIVVLGFRNRSPDRANLLNRWRVRAALRSVDPGAPSSQLVLCGAAAYRGGLSEAALMARYARAECGFTGDLILDEQSRSTSQNVANAIPFLERANRIKLVSNPLHGLRARLYLQHQRPDLAQRVVRAADYQLGEWAVAKPFFAVVGLLELSGTRKSLAATRPPAPVTSGRLSPAGWPAGPMDQARSPVRAGAPEVAVMSCFERCVLIPCLYRLCVRYLVHEFDFLRSGARSGGV